jgi:hypothetical protein
LFDIIIKINVENTDTILLDNTFSKLKTEYGQSNSEIDPALMNINYAGANYDYHIEIDGLNVNTETDSKGTTLSSLRGSILVKKKSAQ